MGIAKEIANGYHHVQEFKDIENAMVFIRRLMENGRQFAAVLDAGVWHVSTPLGGAAPTVTPRGAPPSGGSPAAAQATRLAA